MATYAINNIINVEYCNYDNINEKIKDFIHNEEYLKYDYVYITDISVDEEVAELINNTHPEEFNKGFNLCEMFTLIDHHKTALHLEKYWWCTVKTKNKKGKTSGTSLFCEHLISLHAYDLTPLESFVELVRRYDTWEWKDVYNDKTALSLNNLMYLYGTDRFVEDTLKKFDKDGEFSFSQTDLLLLELEKNRKKKYFDKKRYETYSIPLLSYNAGVVFAEQYISELGNYLAETFPSYDFIVIINGNTISYRGIKDHIDLGAIAKQFGGGGHPKAAGSRIDTSKQLEYVKNLFQKEKDEG